MNIKKRISDTRLTGKIGGSFTLIVILMLVGFTASWISVKTLSSGSNTYLTYTKNMMLCNRLQDAIMQFRLKVVEYNMGGQREAFDSYEKNFAVFRRYIEQSQVDFTVGERPGIVDKIDTYSSQYNTAFTELANLEVLRQEAVGQLKAIGPAVQNKIEKISEAARGNGDLELVDQLDKVEVLLLSSRLAMMLAVNEESKESFAECRQSIIRFIDGLNLLSDSFENGSLKTDWSLLNTEVELYQKSFDNFINSVEKKVAYVEDSLKIIGPKLSQNLEKLSVSITEDVNKLGGELQNTSSVAVSTILIISIVSTVFAVIVSVLLTKIILIPIKKVVRFSEILATGDLTAKTSVDQNDEVGQMAHSLENMAQALNEQFGEIKEGISNLTSSAAELTAISGQLSTNAHDSEEVSQTVAASTEQTSHNMSAVAAAVEEMSTNVSTVASASEEMTSTINEISKNADSARNITMEAVDRVERTSVLMQELEKAAHLIGSVTDTISGISAQTNLLALNATIEAASAGEAGKGFAVVANEIKELSRQTNEATVQISKSISGIQSSTKTSSAEINGIVEIINEISSITSMIASAVEEQSASTSEIANNISQTSDGVLEITKNVTEVSLVANQTSEEVVKVRNSSKEIAGASDNLNSSANEIARFSERLNAIVSQYKVS